MTSYLIDINVWLALTWDLHPQHATVSRWYGRVEDEEAITFLFCRVTMLGFLRLLTNRAVMGGSVVTVAQALALYEQWMDDPRVEMAQEPRGLEKSFREALRPVGVQSAAKAVMDCYLVALAGALAAQVVTLDKGLAGAARGQSVPVTLITGTAG